MKRILIISILLSVSFTGYCQSTSLKKTEIVEDGIDIKYEFVPSEVKINFQNNLVICIEPISPTSLDGVFSNEPYYKGETYYQNYKQSKNSYLLKNQDKDRTTEKSNYELYNEGLNDLLSDGTINQSAYYDLLNQIKKYYGKSRNLYLQSSQKYSELNNPYFLGDKCLCVFKIEIHNTSNVLKKLHLTDIQVCSGNQIQIPLSKHQIFSYYINDDLKTVIRAQILEKYNMQEVIVIPPLSQVVKYFSIIPIDYNIGEYNIFLSSENETKKFTYKITRTENIINNKFTYYELKTLTKSETGYTFRGKVFIGSFEMLDDLLISNNKILVEQNAIHKQLKVCAMYLYNKEIYFAVQTFVAYSFIDFDKLIYDPISLNFSPLYSSSAETQEK